MKTKQKFNNGQIYLYIGARLRELRLEQKITQVQISASAGMHQGFISQIECGKKASWDVLRRISNALGTSLEVVILEALHDF